MRFFHEFDYPPCLGPGQRPAFLDRHQIALMEFVFLIVGVIFLGLRHDLAVERMLDTPLDQHSHCFFHLVADHTAGQRTFVGFAHALTCSAAFSVIRVRTRAMSRRTFFNWLVLESCCVAFCMRRENCAFSNDASSCCNSSADFALNSLAFMV